MATISIETDGILSNTKLLVDGKDVTKNNKVVNISLYAQSPYKSTFSGDLISGGVSVEYAVLDDKGTIERKSLGSAESNYLRGIGQKLKQDDQVTHYVGQATDVKITSMIDKIVAHCEKEKIVNTRYTKEQLFNRTQESLEDLTKDLNIKLED